MGAKEAESLHSEALAYAQQGLVYLEEGDEDAARSMLEVATQLLRLADEQAPERSALRESVEGVLARLERRCAAAERAAPAAALRVKRPLDAELLFWLPEGVQLVTIEGDSTTSTSAPTSLAIFAVERPAESDSLYPKLEDAPLPSALLQVGPWAYPLLPDHALVMQNELGVYVVPNPTEERPDLCVGVILPRDMEAGLERDFVKVLSRFARVRTSDIVSSMSAEERRRTSERIAKFLTRSGERFADQVQKAANSAQDFMSGRGERLRADMTPTDRPVNINPAVKYGVRISYRASKAFAKLSRAILDKVGEVGVSLGRRLAGAGSGSGGSGRLVSGTANVLGGGIAGASVAWIALEDASKQLFRSMAAETVQVVRVKYGEEAGETSHHALHAVGHTTLSAFQLWDLGPRSVAGRMARHAGIQAVKDLGSGKEAPQPAKP